MGKSILLNNLFVRNYIDVRNSSVFFDEEEKEIKPKEKEIKQQGRTGKKEKKKQKENSKDDVSKDKTIKKIIGKFLSPKTNGDKQNNIENEIENDGKENRETYNTSVDEKVELNSSDVEVFDETKENVAKNIETKETIIEETVQEDIVEENEVEPIIEDNETISMKNIDLIKELAEKTPTRRPGSKGEKEAANLLLAKTEETFKVKGGLEPFYVKKFAYDYGMIVIGLLYLITVIIFVFTPITALLFNCLAIIISITRVFFKKELLDVFGKKSIVFNVVNEIKPKETAKNTLILASNYSSARRWNYSGKLKINIKAFAVISFMLLSVEFVCLATLAFGVVNVGLQAVTGVMLALIMAFYLGFYNFSKKQGANIDNGLTGVGMSFALTDYFRQHTELVGDNTNIVFCSFGGGVDGSNGAKAFIKQHFKNNDDFKNAVTLDFEAVTDNKIALYVDAYHGKKNNFVVNKVYEKLSKKRVVNKERGILKGFAVTAFNNIGVNAVGIGNSMRILPKNMNNDKDCIIPNVESTKEQFEFYTEVVADLLKELNKSEN